MPVRRLDETMLQYAGRWGAKGAAVLVREPEVSRPHTHGILAHCRDAGSPPPIRKMGRPRRENAGDGVGEILVAYAAAPAGVVRLIEACPYAVFVRGMLVT